MSYIASNTTFFSHCLWVHLHSPAYLLGFLILARFSLHVRAKGNALELTCKILWTKFTIPIALPLPPIVFNSADSFSDILLFKGSLRIGDSTFVKLPFVTFCCTPRELFSWKSDHLNLDDRGYNEYQQFDIGFWIIPSEKLTLRIQLHFASLARYVCHLKVHQSGLN